MKWLYLFLDLGTWFFPVVLSFDKNVRFIRHWKNTILASVIVGIPFIVWDIYFTKQGVWEFNSRYTLDLFIVNLPVEEILFFIVVPFACIFIYECCKYYLKRYTFHGLNRILFFITFGFSIFLLINAPEAQYTVWVFIAALLVLGWWIFNVKLPFIGVSFTLSIIPFLLINGVLTGAVTDAPIVLYNDLENSQMRLFSIPFEDLLYSFSLIVSSILTFEFLNRRKLIIEKHSDSRNSNKMLK